MHACSRRLSNSSMISSRSSLTAGSRRRENKHMPRHRAHSYGNPRSKEKRLPGAGRVRPGRAEESAPPGEWIAGLQSGTPLWVQSSALGSHQPPGGQTSVQANQTQRAASARQPSSACISRRCSMASMLMSASSTGSVSVWNSWSIIVP